MQQLRLPPKALPFLFCAASALVLWPGLHGPFLLDDFENLSTVAAWDAGERTSTNTLLSNRSGALGRPVAMASFMADAAIAGLDPFQFKLTNLLIHLLCGLVIWRLLRHLLKLDPALATRAATLSALLAGLWLILPAHVSTVLYVVQRMAQLSTLFMLLALWAWTIGRQRAATGQAGGWIWLLLVSPALTALAALSKENGVLVPLLALAVEIAYFRPAAGTSRPAAVKAYFAAFLLIPALAALTLLALKPGFFFDGYAGRAFTLTERALSQPRILWDYTGKLLLPFGPRMGLYHDNYPLSTGLLSPPATLLAILAWLLALATAWRLRHAAPSLLAGLLIFFGGHAMESTLLPLEPYFEHRNYLPSVGMLLAVAGLGHWLFGKLHLSERMAPILKGAGMLAIALLCFATFARSTVWSDMNLLLAQELRYNPDSPRLRSVIAAHFLQAGELRPALEHIEAAEKNLPAREAITAPLWRLLAYCMSNAEPPQTLWEQLRTRSSAPITQYAMVAWEQVAQRVEAGRCPEVEKGPLIDLGREWLSRTTSRPTDHGVWRTRYNLARLLASIGAWDDAISQGTRAWEDSDYNNGVGVFLFQINASAGNIERCREILLILKRSHGAGDLLLDRAIDLFEAAIKSGQEDTAK